MFRGCDFPVNERNWKKFAHLHRFCANVCCPKQRCAIKVPERNSSQERRHKPQDTVVSAMSSRDFAGTCRCQPGPSVSMNRALRNGQLLISHQTLVAGSRQSSALFNVSLRFRETGRTTSAYALSFSVGTRRLPFQPVPKGARSELGNSYAC